MGWVFGSQTTSWFRFKVWLADLARLILALPSYLNPKPLQPPELTEEEKLSVEKMLQEDQNDT